MSNNTETIVETQSAPESIPAVEAQSLGNMAVRAARPLATEVGDPYFRHPLVAMRDASAAAPPKYPVEAYWDEQAGKIAYYKTETQ